MELALLTIDTGKLQTALSVTGLILENKVGLRHRLHTWEGSKIKEEFQAQGARDKHFWDDRTPCYMSKGSGECHSLQPASHLWNRDV